MVIVIILSVVYLIGIPFFQGVWDDPAKNSCNENILFGTFWPVVVPFLLVVLLAGSAAAFLYELGQKLGTKLDG